MSKTIVLNLPEHGHINATLPVVAELVRRGEQVLYYGTEPYREAIAEAGAHYLPYPGDHAAFNPPAHRGGLYSVMAYLMSLAETVLPEVIARIEDEHPDYLLIDSMCVWGHLASRVTRVPAATIASVFVPNPDLVTPEQMLAQVYGGVPREVVLAGIDALNQYIETSRRIDRRYGTVSPNLVEFFAGRQPLNVSFTSRLFHLGGEHYGDDYLFTGPSIVGTRKPAANTAAHPLVFVSLGTCGTVTGVARFFREKGGRIRLQPANQRMEPIFVKEKDLAIRGRVVAVLRKYR